MSTSTALQVWQPTLFDYDELPADDADWLRQQTTAIVQLCSKILEQHVLLGRALIAVQNRLVKGQFSKWIRSELFMTRSTVYFHMDVAEKFGPIVLANPSAGQTRNIEQKALHLLCQKGVDPDARTAAVKMAADHPGRPVTLADAVGLIKLYRKDAPAVTKSWTTEYEERMKPIRDHEKATRVPLPAPEVDSRKTRGWDALEELCRMARVGIETVEDSEDSEDYQFFLRAYFEDGRPRSVVRMTLLDAVESLLGREEKKRCGSCYNKFIAAGMLPDDAEARSMQPVSWFVDNRSKRGGKASECKSCSRPRVRASKRRMKEREPEPMMQEAA